MRQFDRALRQNGAAAVELAIILPVVLALTLGIIYASIGWNTRSGLDHAAREAARIGAVLPDDGNWGSAVQDEIDARLESVMLTGPVTYCKALFVENSGGNVVLSSNSPDADCVDEGANTQERVEIRLQTTADLQFFFFTETVTITSDAVSRYER